MRNWITNRKEQVAEWLRMGMSPQRLALTLALGFVLGCVPMVGVPTALCALAAVALKLNLPAIQAANYAAMPVQLMLMLPFMRMGHWMFSTGHEHAIEKSLLHDFSLATLRSSGSMAGQAMGAWLVLAVPTMLLMTFTLTKVLQRIPAMAEAGGE
jgi:uncharacterized protein (DUF2062 family)